METPSLYDHCINTKNFSLHSTFSKLPLHRTIIFTSLVGIEAIFLMQKWEPIFHFFSLSCFIALTIVIADNYKPCRSVYMVDFSCLKPPNYCRVPFCTFLEHASMIPSFDAESINFMSKVLNSSGQSEETYLPPALHCIPPGTHQHEAIKEAEMVMFPVIEDLLCKTNVSSSDIDILIVNCSGFCPSPSLASIVVNKFAMRDDIKSFNLSGMGCSASAISVDLANNLLQVHDDSYALVVSTEILSTGWYSGHQREKLVLNCLFRMGSAAVLLSNKKASKRTSKYKLLQTVRTQRAYEDRAYYSAFREEDDKGNLGVTLRRDLLTVAGVTLRSNITILGSQVLPLMEKLWHVTSRKNGYVPNFKCVINHFCLPVSGKPVIREIGKALGLGERETEAALMTLHRFGNQSSSSLWYELAYLEIKNRVRCRDTVWQLGMGTGPKCCSLVWECVRPIELSASSPWADCAHRYPIHPIN